MIFVIAIWVFVMITCLGTQIIDTRERHGTAMYYLYAFLIKYFNHFEAILRMMRLIKVIN